MCDRASAACVDFLVGKWRHFLPWFLISVSLLTPVIHESDVITNIVINIKHHINITININININIIPGRRFAVFRVSNHFDYHETDDIVSWIVPIYHTSCYKSYIYNKSRLEEGDDEFWDIREIDNSLFLFISHWLMIRGKKSETAA